MKLLHPVSLAVAIALGGASYLAYQNAQPSIYEQKADYLAAKAEKKANSPKRYDKPKEAQEFYISQRLPKGAETLPTEKYSKALEHIKTMKRYSLAESSVVFDYAPRLNSTDGVNRESGEIGRAPRLNSSHTVISYAVFCLKKKKKKTEKKKEKKRYNH